MKGTPREDEQSRSYRRRKKEQRAEQVYHVLLDSYILNTASFILFYFIFNWSIVDLQCCVSFRYYSSVVQLYIHIYIFFIHTHTHTHTHTQIYIFSDSFPLWVITKHWVEFPMLYSRSLFICFIHSSVYMLIPNSLFIPPFSFGNHKFVFYVSGSISVL